MPDVGEMRQVAAVFNLSALHRLENQNAKQNERGNIFVFEISRAGRKVVTKDALQLEWKPVLVCPARAGQILCGLGLSRASCFGVSVSIPDCGLVLARIAVSPGRTVSSLH